MESPSTTLYLNNLNERIFQRRLREEIGKICEPYGPILKISTGRGIRKRGQAFVAFQALEDAQKAQQSLQGHIMFAKPIKVSFAYAPSNLAGGGDPSTSQSQMKTADQREKIGSSNNTPEIPDKQKFPTQKPEGQSFGTPNSRLLLQNIPDEINLEKLIEICSFFPGFSEARMFAARHVGFVDFESVEAASAAISDLSQKGLGEIKYAKK